MIETGENWYPGPGDLGIDEGVRAKIANVILDASIELPVSGRTNAENLNQWNTEDLITYGKWLSAVLNIGDSGTGPLLKEHVNRASKLNLGPSFMVIEKDPEIGTQTNYQRLLDQKPVQPYKDMSKAELLQKAVVLTRRHGRLTREKLDMLSRKGVFMGCKATTTRFGSLSHFHELAGSPSVRGWEEDNYVAWGIAFMNQNEGRPIDNPSVVSLSKRKVGPSDRSIQVRFDGVVPFAERVKHDYELQQLERAEREQMRLEQIKIGLEDGIIPPELFEGIEESAKIKVFALFCLASSLIGPENRYKLKIIARNPNPDTAARLMIKENSKLTMATIELQADRLGLTDDIWPMARFQNVDLKIAA